MSWGSGFFYYHCPDCGKKFKYAVEDIPDFGDGPRIPQDLEYFEVER